MILSLHINNHLYLLKRYMFWTRLKGYKCNTVIALPALLNRCMASPYFPYLVQSISPYLSPLWDSARLKCYFLGYIFYVLSAISVKLYFMSYEVYSSTPNIYLSCLTTSDSLFVLDIAWNIKRGMAPYEHNFSFFFRTA